MSHTIETPSPLSRLFLALLLIAIGIGCGLYVTERILDPQSADKRLLELSHQFNQTYCAITGSSDLCLPVSATSAAPSTSRTTAPAPVAPINHPVFGNMIWQGGSEAEAAAFMTRAKTLAMLHFEEKHKYLRKDIKALIAPVWRDYPTLVSASACLYCGDITDAVLDFIQEYELSPDWIEQVGKGISRYLPHLSRLGVLDDEELYRLARIQAQLGSAGDSRVAKAIAEPLLRHHDMEHLAMWVMNGLNGGRAVTDREVLEQLPQEVIILAWRHGVAMGYDSIELTEFLLQSGYRPALRWLVWLQDGGATYLTDKYSSYSRHGTAQRYTELLKSHTDFPVHQGSELGAFYSKHWNSILWDSGSKVWRRNM